MSNALNAINEKPTPSKKVQRLQKAWGNWLGFCIVSSAVHGAFPVFAAFSSPGVLPVLPPINAARHLVSVPGALLRCELAFSEGWPTSLWMSGATAQPEIAAKNCIWDVNGPDGGIGMPCWEIVFLVSAGSKGPKTAVRGPDPAPAHAVVPSEHLFQAETKININQATQTTPRKGHELHRKFQKRHCRLKAHKLWCLALCLFDFICLFECMSYVLSPLRIV